VKWAQNQGLGEKSAATSKRLRSTVLADLQVPHQLIDLSETNIMKNRV